MPKPVVPQPTLTTQAWASHFRSFFSEGTPAAACAPLSPGACVHLCIQTHSSPHSTLTFIKNASGEVTILEGETSIAQASLTLSAELTHEILNLKSDSIGDFGVLILSAFLGKPRRLQVRTHVGFVELWRKGWFGVLALGGGQVASYLASHGLNGIGGIQRALKALRSEVSQTEKELRP